ncbi:MAG TPA: zinc-ribbon domain-containing protein [Solirubrobacteraceae bacterium]|nr:zinc-ribbon domain-containing protein [Solirubrobacteraceae bacterium]
MSGEGAHTNGELHCPRCGLEHDAGERFCRDCGMPLVQAEGDDAEVDERRRRARRIKPQYTEGELVRVARAQNQSEAELIENLLLARGIPSLLRRSAGVDVPDMLAAGARDVLVPESAVQAAREALAPQPG